MKRNFKKLGLLVILPLALTACGGKYISRDAAVLMLGDIAVFQASEEYTIPFDLTLTYSYSTYENNEVSVSSYVVEVSKSSDYIHYIQDINGETYEKYEYQRNGSYYRMTLVNGVLTQNIHQAADESQIRDLAGTVSYSQSQVSAFIQQFSSPVEYNGILGCTIVEEIEKLNNPSPNHSYKETYNAKGVGSLDCDIATYLIFDGGNHVISTLKCGYSNNLLTLLQISKNLEYSFSLSVNYHFVPTYPTYSQE